MSSSVPAQPERRLVLAGLAAAAAWPAHAARARLVVMLGDSITAGYGLAAGQALPVRLEAELARIGAPAQVINAGRSGDTTATAAARAARAAPADADLVVVAVGGNDLLNGVAPDAVQENLDRIVRTLLARRQTVVLAGVRLPLLLGDYAVAFNDAFARVARAHRLLFLPDLLAGVALNPDLNQDDMIHPNARGVAVIARRLAPLVAKGLAAR
ncbi:MAG: GDSL-type esterase/lipase family protein [Phenylobacterium sp.]